jgi:thiol-disulfide isomerase/thioredoxin
MNHRFVRAAAIALPLILATPLVDCSSKSVSKPKVAVEFKTAIPDLKELPTKGSVVVQLCAKWCVPCHSMMNEITEGLRRSEPTIQVFKLDIDVNPELTKKLVGTDSPSIPKLLFFKDGAEVGRVEAYSTGTSLIDIKRLLKKLGLL